MAGILVEAAVIDQLKQRFPADHTIPAVAAALSKALIGPSFPCTEDILPISMLYRCFKSTRMDKRYEARHMTKP